MGRLLLCSFAANLVCSELVLAGAIEFTRLSGVRADLKTLGAVFTSACHNTVTVTVRFCHCDVTGHYFIQRLTHQSTFSQAHLSVLILYLFWASHRDGHCDYLVTSQARHRTFSRGIAECALYCCR